MAKRYPHVHRVSLDDDLSEYVTETADRLHHGESATIRQMIAESRVAAIRRATMESEINRLGGLS